MPLDPQAKAYLDQVAAAHVQDVPAISVREARALMELGTMMLGKPPRIGHVEDGFFPSAGGRVKFRVTTPEGPGPFPALVYLHGGGFAVGSLSSHDHLCRALTNEAQVAVVSVDYRLAPSIRFRPRSTTPGPCFKASLTPPTRDVTTSTPRGWPSVATAPAAISRPSSRAAPASAAGRGSRFNCSFIPSSIAISNALPIRNSPTATCSAARR